MIKFYSFPLSPNGRRVHFALEEMGFPYEVQVLNLLAGEHKRSDFMAINPNGKVPAIVDDGFSLYESFAIVYYLAEKSQKFLPKDASTRAKVMQWMFYLAAQVNDSFGLPWFQFALVPEGKRDTKAIAAAQESAKGYLSVMEQALGANEYLTGAFSIADISVASAINLHHGAQIDLSAFPKVKAWLDKVRARPAWIKTEPKM
jgi:GSH-dependent disulfide-bond oxidoreductase